MPCVMLRACFRLPFVPDLVRTLAGLAHGRHDPTIRVGIRRALRATRTPEGPGSELIEVRGNEVTVSAWGPGASWLVAAAPALLGAEDDAAGFTPRDPVIQRLHDRFPHLRIGRSGAVIEALVPAILEQKVTGVAARRSYRGLVARYGQDAPGPFGLRLQPSPDVLASLPYFAFHPFNVERRRAETIREACRRAVRLEEAAAMSGPDAERRLRAIPGVGAWTAAVVRSVALGDPDAVEVGDFHIPSEVAWALGGRGTRQRRADARVARAPLWAEATGAEADRRRRGAAPALRPPHVRRRLRHLVAGAGTAPGR